MSAQMSAPNVSEATIEVFPEKFGTVAILAKGDATQLRQAVDKELKTGSLFALLVAVSELKELHAVMSTVNKKRAKAGAKTKFEVAYVAPTGVTVYSLWRNESTHSRIPLMGPLVCGISILMFCANRRLVALVEEAGMWKAVTGYKSPQESSVEAARRELVEETANDSKQTSSVLCGLIAKAKITPTAAEKKTIVTESNRWTMLFDKMAKFFGFPVIPTKDECDVFVTAIDADAEHPPAVTTDTYECTNVAFWPVDELVALPPPAKGAFVVETVVKGQLFAQKAVKVGTPVRISARTLDGIRANSRTAASTVTMTETITAAAPPVKSP